MADIELVIKIPEETYKNVNERFIVDFATIGKAIRNGTPLPKGHGRIVDIDKLINSKCNDCGHIKGVTCTVPCYEVRRMSSASTIIEADKESTDANTD